MHNSNSNLWFDPFQVLLWCCRFVADSPSRSSHLLCACGLRVFEATLPSSVNRMPIVPGANGDSCDLMRGDGKYHASASGDNCGAVGGPSSASTCDRDMPIWILANSSRTDVS